MPIKSYLAHPKAGEKGTLIKALSLLNGCEVIPATNKEVLVVVTETSDDASDAILKEKIEGIDSLKLLALVSGFNNPQN
jgi:nitrate reductase NapAB chaperone NapD